MPGLNFEVGNAQSQGRTRVAPQDGIAEARERHREYKVHITFFFTSVLLVTRNLRNLVLHTFGF